MKTQLQFIERKRATDWNDQLTVDDELFRFERGNGANDIREITREGLSRFRLQKNLAAIAKSETTKAVPFRFVLPIISNRNFVDRSRFHRRQWWFDGKRH